jgi:two-component system KDP operon response regulator KdpE
MAIHEATVLLIEDEAEIRRFLRTSLPAHGYRLYEATTATDGLAQARRIRHHLARSGLPDVDGIEVIQQVRSGPPLILVLSGAQGTGEGRGVDLGADDYGTDRSVNELLGTDGAATPYHRTAGRTGRASHCLGDIQESRPAAHLKEETHLRRLNTSC